MKKRHNTPRKSVSGRRKKAFRAERASTGSADSREPIGDLGFNSAFAVQRFEPEPQAVYSLELAARLTGAPRRTILTWCKHHLVEPLADPVIWGYWFSGEAIQQMRRIEALRSTCGDDFAGIGIILNLLAEVEILRAQVRSTAI